MSDPLITVQNAYAAIGEGDVAGLLNLIARDAPWTFAGDRKMPYTTTVRGHGGIGEWFGMVARHDDIQAFEPREFLVGPDHVTVLGFERTKDRTTGREFECEWVHVWRVSGGLITRFFGMLDSEAAAAARA